MVLFGRFLTALTVVCASVADNNACLAFAPLCPSGRALRRFSLSSSQESEQERLLRKASELRKEASELESALSASGASPRRAVERPSTGPVYTEMADSVWVFSYRFSDQPEPKETATADAPKRTFYSGKLTLRMRSDGYTDIVKHEGGGPGPALTIVKAWGWDVERSAEDEKEYLLFSVDADVNSVGATNEKMRFYFQARQESDEDGSGISLKEGTVTIKQDVVDSKASGWGFFSARGILAEFRYVGNFVAKPE